METSQDISKLFYSDAANKKRAGTGAFKRKKKTGGAGRVKTTSDVLQGYARKNYMRAGAVKLTNIYTDIFPIEELKTYNEEQQQTILSRWYDQFRESEIMDKSGANRNTLEKLRFDLKVHMPSKEPGYEKPDVPTLEEFYTLPARKQLVYLTDYAERYGAYALAEVWNKYPSYIYNRKLNLKKKVKRQEEKGKEHHSDYDNEQEQIKGDLGELEQSEGHSSGKDNNASQPAGNAKFEDDDVTGDTFVGMIKTDDINAEPIKKTGLSFQYEEEKEGFIVHQELKQLLKMLEKNPETYHVTLSIEKASSDDE